MLKKKILITGGAGMIGKALVSLLHKKYSLIILDKKSQLERNRYFFKKFDIY